MSETESIDPYADHQRMENHWWWRPGWRVGTRFYAWHITLDGQDDLHGLMDEYVEALRPFRTLDPVPAQWRHITLQGLGHAEDVTDARRDAASDAISERLSRLEPIQSTFQRAAIFKEAVALPPSNPEAFTRLRSEIRAGIADAWGQTPEKADGFRAHTSVAYSNARGDGLAVRRSLMRGQFVPAKVLIGQVDLICMHRDDGMYEWVTERSIPIGSS